MLRWLRAWIEQRRFNRRFREWWQLVDGDDYVKLVSCLALIELESPALDRSAGLMAHGDAAMLRNAYAVGVLWIVKDVVQHDHDADATAHLLAQARDNLGRWRHLDPVIFDRLAQAAPRALDTMWMASTLGPTPVLAILELPSAAGFVFDHQAVPESAGLLIETNVTLSHLRRSLPRLETPDRLGRR